MNPATALSGASIRRLQDRVDNDHANLIASWMDFESARSLADTFPSIYGWPDRVTRLGATLDGELISHAAVREVTLQTSLGERNVALIGSVATSPEHRRQGIASHLLQHVVEVCKENGLDAALLWSQHWDFYGRLGFRPCGQQWEFCNPPLPGTRETPPDSARARPAVLADLPHLWELHEQKPLRVRRDLGEMARLVSTRGMRTVVLEQRDTVVAYACQGKGEDLQGWWHEFGGTDKNILRLLQHVPASHGETTLLIPDYRNELRAQLAAGRSAVCALVRPLSRQLGEFFVDGLDSV